MKYKMIIFDLDGTILNTISDLHQALSYALVKNDLEDISIDDTRRYVGNGIKMLCHLASKGIKEDLVYNDFRNYYSMHSCDMSYVYKNIPSLLLKLKGKAILGILSNKKDGAVKIINDYYFKDIFDFAYGERDGVLRKPSKEALDPIINEYNISKDEIVYIGDSEVDIKFSENAGIDYIICSWGFRSKEEILKYNPKILVDDPMDILSYL